MMLRARAFVGLIAFVLIQFASSAPGTAAPRFETRYSRFGDVVLKADFENGSSISVNGQVVFASQKLTYLSFIQVVSAKDRDYVVVAENLGGSGTPDEYSIISIGPKGFHKVFRGVDLEMDDGHPEYKVSGASVRFTLKDQGVYTMAAVIAGDKLIVRKKQMTQPKSLSSSDCEYLFAQVLSACANERQAGCSDTLDNMPMAVQRSMYSISRNVFFPAKAFSALCDAACRRGHVWISYGQFAKNMCYFY